MPLDARAAAAAPALRGVPADHDGSAAPETPGTTTGGAPAGDGAEQQTPERPSSAREQATEDLLERASSAAEPERSRLLDEVVVLNLPVAKALAARFRDRGEQLDDLVQVASLALVKAAQGYQPGKGRGFLPYAVPTITVSCAATSATASGASGPRAACRSSASRWGPRPRS